MRPDRWSRRRRYAIRPTGLSRNLNTNDEYDEISRTTLLSVVLLIGLTACSTASQAEYDEEAERAQLQPHQQSDDHAYHHPADQQAETAQAGDDLYQMMEQHIQMMRGARAGCPMMPMMDEDPKPEHDH